MTLPASFAWLRTYATVVALLVICGVFAALSPDAFASVGNAVNVSRQIAFLVLVAIGATLVMACGEFDLSVGAVASFAGVMAAQLDKGIPVFGCDSGYIPGMVMNATSDNAAMSAAITQFLMKSIDDKGSLVVFTHRPHPGVLKRTQELDALLKKSPNVKVRSELHVQVPGPIESARTQMENLLLANPAKGSITAVWAAWDEPAIGATQAIQAAGRTEIVVTGIDGTSQAVDLVKKGSPLIATMKQNFPGMADLVVTQIEATFKGQKPTSTEMFAPAMLVTK